MDSNQYVLSELAAPNFEHLVDPTPNEIVQALSDAIDANLCPLADTMLEAVSRLISAIPSINPVARAELRVHLSVMSQLLDA